MTPRAAGAGPSFTDPAYSILYAPDRLDPPVREADTQELLVRITPNLGDPLNPEQTAGFARSFDSRASLLWGPPGTGKTTVLAAAVLGWLEWAEAAEFPVRICLGSSNWNAIDHLLRSVADLIELRRERNGEFDTPIRLARLRSSYSAPAPFDQRIEDVARFTPEADELADDLEGEAGSFVIGSTWQQLSKLANARSILSPRRPVARWFDLVIIDEASQVKVAPAAAYLLLLKEHGHAVFSGDHRQLGPIYQFDVQDTAGGLFDCIFTYMEETHQLATTKLVRNYRTNIEIADWPKVRFYGGAYESIVPERRLAVTLPPDQPVGWPAGLPWSSIWRDILDPDLPVAVITYPAAS